MIDHIIHAMNITTGLGMVGGRAVGLGAPIFCPPSKGQDSRRRRVTKPDDIGKPWESLGKALFTPAIIPLLKPRSVTSLQDHPVMSLFR